MAVEIDLLGDFEKWLRNELDSNGYEIAPGDDLNSLLRVAINFNRRQIPQKNWTVHESGSVTAKKASLSPDLKNGFDYFLNQAKSGLALKPHLSTLTERADYNDPLFNDWGVFHFHLGVAPHPSRSGFVERTDTLLFAIANQDDLYFLDLHPHANAFSRVELLEIVEQNWPTLLDKHVLKNVLDVRPQLTDAQISQCRKAGINVLIKLSSGRVLGGIGGGVSTARTNMMHQIEADKRVFDLRAAENEIRSQEAIMRKLLAENGHACPEPISLSLHRTATPNWVLRESTLDIDFIELNIPEFPKGSY